VARATEQVREQSAEYPLISDARPAQMGDYVVVDYQGTVDGEPVSIKFPKAGQPLTANANFWILMTEEAFFPGFCGNLVGLNPGDTREFDITVPSDFLVEGMPGQVLHYSVTLREIHSKVLPELNDEFAKTAADVDTVEMLSAELRQELERQKAQIRQNSLSNQIIKRLVEQVECELPTPLVNQEAQRHMSRMVRESYDRGIPEETIREHQREIAVNSAELARQSVKSRFILLKIAQAEKIGVTDEEMGRVVYNMAIREGVPPENKFKELQRDQDKLSVLREEVIKSKTLEFLLSRATLSEAPNADIPAGQDSTLLGDVAPANA
jgi:trigger factor